MSGRRAKQYRGKLSAPEIADGMNAAVDNARRLASDARLLLEAGRAPSAFALAALAIEEAGKTSILRAVALARTDKEAAEEWRAYRRHQSKNRHWTLPKLVAEGARQLEDFRALHVEPSGEAEALDMLKQLCLYTDCLEDRKWCHPVDAVTAEAAESLVRTAELLSAARLVKAREIELWVEHLGPVWKGPLEWMKQALMSWHEAMRAEGHLPPDGPSMEHFLGRG